MENEIRERSVEVDGMTLTLLHKDGKWVFPPCHILPAWTRNTALSGIAGVCRRQ